MAQFCRDGRQFLFTLAFIFSLLIIITLYISTNSTESEVTTTGVMRTSDQQCYEEERVGDFVADLQISLGLDLIENYTVKPLPVPDNYTVNVTIPNLALSTCSDRATARGPHQKIITFAFFGKVNCSRNYFLGIEENAKLAAMYYPDWVIRIYYEFTPPDKEGAALLADIESRYHNVDSCDTLNIPGIGNLKGTHPTIRCFLPMADPLVDIFISRDLDSRLNTREVAAVNDWLESGLTFHVMRDTPYHVVVILSGMWGGRVHQARELMLSLALQLFMRGRFEQIQSFDQDLLKLLVWPVMKGHVAQHDSYFCESVLALHGNMRAFPTQRMKNTTNNNVGANVFENMIIDNVCPEACRPNEHKDWELC